MKHPVNFAAYKLLYETVILNPSPPHALNFDPAIGRFCLKGSLSMATTGNLSKLRLFAMS
jgi:hypothetical protein